MARASQRVRAAPLDAAWPRCILRTSRGASPEAPIEKLTPPFARQIFVCVNRRDDGTPSCAARGSEALLDRLKAAVKERGLKGKVRVYRSGCQDRCNLGPNLLVYPDSIWLKGVTEADLEAVIRDHLDPLARDPRSGPPPRGEVHLDQGRAGLSLPKI